MVTLIVLAVLGLGAFGLWRWAVAQGSAGTLEWIDARFARDVPARLAAQGRYGPADQQNAELWTPAGKAPAGGWPLVVFIYGGGWHSGDTPEYRFVARTLAERGYATALVGYRLVPEGRFPAMLKDSAAGVRWARDHAAAAQVSADKLVLAGHSAGAYNVLMLTLDPQWLAEAGVPERAIAGTVSLAGPADFYPFTSDSARNAMAGVTDPRTTQPINFARADAPPILLLHGTDDTVVRVRNSRRLASALKSAGGRVQEVEFEGMGHAGIIMALSKPFAQGGKVLDPLLAFAAQARGASVPVQRENR
ncbi:alpha/beta hydrolase [Altererythrobacter sp. TH136]|uniref:alpha/beta hydrolase n=1 Tax=Altererythrobacter sp. TH136 TaxID=2067415 RepID=UPI001161DC6B|nr:alpha/beta hydrolase [Altererythrobacter sp. TH136]QDM41143.1 alpha/beta hydrolase [Altererythrobacter sp. TH136]